MVCLTNLFTRFPPMPPKFNRKRALFVLTKIDEILAWERQKEAERDTRFVELSRYLCEVRAGLYWRLENLKSLDHLPHTSPAHPSGIHPAAVQLKSRHKTMLGRYRSAIKPHALTSARADPCGGRSAMVVPTTTTRYGTPEQSGSAIFMAAILTLPNSGS